MLGNWLGSTLERGPGREGSITVPARIMRSRSAVACARRSLSDLATFRASCDRPRPRAGPRPFSAYHSRVRTACGYRNTEIYERVLAIGTQANKRKKQVSGLRSARFSRHRFGEPRHDVSAPLPTTPQPATRDGSTSPDNRPSGGRAPESIMILPLHDSVTSPSRLASELPSTSCLHGPTFSYDPRPLPGTPTLATATSNQGYPAMRWLHGGPGRYRHRPLCASHLSGQSTSQAAAHASDGHLRGASQAGLRWTWRQSRRAVQPARRCMSQGIPPVARQRHPWGSLEDLQTVIERCLRVTRRSPENLPNSPVSWVRTGYVPASSCLAAVLVNFSIRDRARSLRSFRSSGSLASATSSAPCTARAASSVSRWSGEVSLKR